MDAHITPERLITFLLETPMFDNLDPAEIRQVLHIVEAKSLQAGDVVFSEGDAGDAWYVLYTGGVEVLKRTADGENVIATLGPQTCFGEISILDGLPRSATVRASEDSVVYCIPRSAFEDLVTQGDLVAYKLLYHMAILLAQRQRATTDTLSKLLHHADVSDVHEGIRQIVGESSVRE
jgi:CRP-like cAMP-binding protein